MSYVAERRAEEKDRRRAEIVDAAVELYREVGWDAVTIDQVAKRARLSRALVYVYFQDKDELHCSIVLRAFELLDKRFAEAAERVKLGLDKIEVLGRAYVAFANEFPHFFNACARFESTERQDTQPNSLLEACVAAGNRVHERTISALQIGIADGTIRADVGDTQVVAISMWGFSHGLIQIAMTKADMLARQGISVPQLLEQSVSLLRRMLAR
jgi:AcrR family transcriptional regulator